MNRKKEILNTFRQALILRKQFAIKVSLVQDEIFHMLMMMKKEFPEMTVAEVFKDIDLELFSGIADEDAVRKEIKKEISETDQF